MTVTSRHPDAETEYGRGLIICLVKFAEHAEDWFKRRETYADMRVRHDNAVWSESSAIERFFKGASDHLREIEVPQKWKKTKLAEKVSELQDFALMIARGFTAREHSPEDITKAYDLCEEIALMLDRMLGVPDADIGKW